MKNFNVFQHPVLGYEAVKKGFSWPGFVTALFNAGWIWALCKRLWLAATILFIVEAFAGMMVLSGDEAAAQSGIIASFAVAIVVGIFGNAWRASYLTKRGYKSLKVVQAATPEAAIAQVAIAK